MTKKVSLICLAVMSFLGLGHSANEIYIAKGNSIIKVNQTGTFSNWITGIEASAITSDTSGNLYVGGDDGFVEKISPQGTITLVGTIATSGLPSPSIRGIAVGINGTVYTGVIGGPNNISVYKIETNGIVNPYAFGLGASLSGMAINASGELFVTCQNDILYKINSSNNIVNFASGFSQLISVTADLLGNIIVHDIATYGINKIYKITPNGAKTLIATINATTPSGNPTSAGGITVDNQGNIYASTWGGWGEYIDKIETNNSVTRYSSGIGGGSMTLISTTQSVPIVQTNTFSLITQRSSDLTNWVSISTNIITDTNSSSFFRLKIQQQ